MWASWNPWAAWKDNFMTPHRLRQELKFSETLERNSFPWPWQRQRSAPKSECFLVLRKTLLVRLCVVAWVLFSVFSIFYITSLGDCNRLQHQELPQKMQNSLRSLSKDVFERRTSTGSEAFSLYMCLDPNKFVLLTFFSLIKTIYPRVSTDPLLNDAKSPLPVVVRCSKMLLLKLPIYLWKAHVVCITDAKEDWRTCVTGETRANGAQCLSSLKADKTLLVKAARGGCCNKELGGWRSAPVSSGYGNKNKSN